MDKNKQTRSIDLLEKITDGLQQYIMYGAMPRLDVDSLKNAMRELYDVISDIPIETIQDVDREPLRTNQLFNDINMENISFDSTNVEFPSENSFDDFEQNYKVEEVSILETNNEPEIMEDISPIEDESVSKVMEIENKIEDLLVFVNDNQVNEEVIIEEIAVDSINDEPINEEGNFINEGAIETEELFANFNIETFSINEFIVHNASDEYQQLKSSKIDSIKKAIPLNDKFRFIKNLFNDDFELFASVVDEIDLFTTLEEVDSYIDNNLNQKLFKDKDESAVTEFFKYVFRRFC